MTGLPHKEVQYRTVISVRERAERTEIDNSHCREYGEKRQVNRHIRHHPIPESFGVEIQGDSDETQWERYFQRYHRRDNDDGPSHTLGGVAADE